LSVAPSLIPRSSLIQGLLAGTLAAIGYGLGALVGWSARRRRHQPRWRSNERTRAAALLLGSAVVTGALLVGRRWQADLAELTGVPAPGSIWVGVAALVGLGVFLGLIMLGRGIRWVVRRLESGLRRIAAPRVATASAVTVSVLVGAVAIDRLPSALASTLSPLFRSMNASTPAGVSPPSSPFVSGGPGSALPWETLGSQGRAFVAGVTPAAQLTSFTGTAAQDPIRVFVGIDAAGTPEQRARLAVDELERFGAFDRAVIAIGTSAGAGTVDPGEVIPLEYMLNGDVATVSTQYSILPSFLSFAVDRPNSVTESVAVLRAVSDRLEQVSPAQRPRLVVFGESLGAYGASGAFTSLDDLIARTDGAMFQGPPNATSLWREYTDLRDAGSPEHLPVYGGGTHLRWANQPDDLAHPPGPFRAPRVVYLQNASDPVVWWSPDLLWSRPDWLAEPRGQGVLTWPWLPVITFAGVTGDMMNSQGVPAGHGHVYGTDPVVAWADILRPPGWTSADTGRLVQHLGR
jgi:uncharacterized membrane protein